MDHYSILGVDKSASDDEIKKAYRKLAFAYHPDRNPGDKAAEQKFKEVQNAYDTLTNPGSSSVNTGPHFSNLWETFFSVKPEPERGRNIQSTIEIELKDVLTGCTKILSVPQKAKCVKCDGNGYSEFKTCATCGGHGKLAIRQSPFNIYIGCSACGGSGKVPSTKCDECKGIGSLDKSVVELNVNIPPGVESGQKMVVPGYGEVTETKKGDLIIVILVKNHKYFIRQGANIILEFPVSYSELCLGTKIDVPTLTGSAILTIPPHTVDGTKFHLRSMGLPYVHGGKGDLIVLVHLVLPSKDRIDEYKTLLESLADLDKEALMKQRSLYSSE
jgi:molecular chaperone DnaJ